LGRLVLYGLSAHHTFEKTKQTTTQQIWGCGCLTKWSGWNVNGIRNSSLPLHIPTTQYNTMYH